jgi:hypothetical protein
MASSFSKRLQREVLGNPKKAGLLGLLCLVAGYFWAPLLAGSFKEADLTAPATSTDLPPNGVAVPSSANAQTAATASLTWKQVAECLDRTKSQGLAPVPADARDPFKTAVQAQTQTESVVEVRTSGPSLSPQDAGLSLSSTMVGPRYSVALIGGESYRIGDEVPSSTDEAISFRLKSIHAKHVMLERNGEEFELALKAAESLENKVTAAGNAGTTQDASPEDE